MRRPALVSQIYSKPNEEDTRKDYQQLSHSLGRIVKKLQTSLQRKIKKLFRAGIRVQ